MFIILLVIGAVLLALAAVGVGGNLDLLALGLFVWLATVILRVGGLV